MFDKITMRFVTILTAGYGLSPSDIGFAKANAGYTRFFLVGHQFKQITFFHFVNSSHI